MQIILLCGGSGTRLWPLSNQTRSKQFLKLFSTPDGTAESMFQRVLRQIRESKLNATISVATSESQLDSVIAQGGEGISIITEPSRRDTFPAIALATSYLAKVKKISPDEAVVVIPCDPYTEAGYYESIAEMVKMVKSDEADLVLMGIEPTEPSSKFGYIIPSTTAGEKISFIEKPDRNNAEALIANGALWNGGVFAFKLAYLLNIISNYSSYNDFESIRTHYSDFPKISFDYEVVEKAESLGVVKYKGEWKDLGTWASLCNELPGANLGNVHSSDNRSTTIINELALPIISCGCSNLIVAVSPDGILVADKDRSEAIKESVKELNLRPMYEERRWGYYRVLDSTTFDNGSSALTKCLVLTPGSSISYQRHKHREEVWTIVDGIGEVVTGSERRTVRPGDVIVISAGMMHALRASTQLTLIEVQRGSQLVEEDIERFDFDW